MSYYVWRTNTVLSENPHLNLGGEFARSARWPMMISQIETPRMMHVKPKTPIRADASEKRTAHLMEDFVAVYLLKSFFQKYDNGGFWLSHNI